MSDLKRFMAFQEMAKAAGYYDGAIDGLIGPKSRVALEKLGVGAGREKRNQPNPKKVIVQSGRPGFAAVGEVWTAESLRARLSMLAPPAWAKFVVFHHTAIPNLQMRPDGLTVQHIRNIRHGYIKDRGFQTGPHFFVDDDQIFGMTDPQTPGTHAASFNANGIGIEVLGDFDFDDPTTGRGLSCWTVAAAAAVEILDWLGLPIAESSIRFHRDCSRTKKSCPGKRVTKKFVLGLMGAARGAVPMSADLGSAQERSPVVAGEVEQDGSSNQE